MTDSLDREIGMDEIVYGGTAYGLVQFSARSGRLRPQQVIGATGTSSPDLPQAVMDWQHAEDRLVAGGDPAAIRA
jgi:hypothetical protein